MTGAFIFFIGLSGNFLVKHLHEPANVVKPFAPGIDENVDLATFVRLQMFAINKLLRDFIGLEELMPASNNDFGRCAVGAFSVNMQYNVVVIRKDCERSDVDIEDGSEP